jgi:hypothetical protein
MLQRHAIEKLHGDERLFAMPPDFINGADVGMVQRRRGLRLALKAGERLRIFGVRRDSALKPSLARCRADWPVIPESEGKRVVVL